MKPINLNNVEEKSAGGDFKRLEAGAYACIITAVEDVPEREYLNALLDIAVGDFAGYFDDSFYANKPWAHRIVMSYKDANLCYLKHNLRMITESNTGFDAEAAVMGGREQMLVGKAVGCTFRAEEYYDKHSDEFKIGSPRPDMLISTHDVGGVKPRDPKTLDRAGKIAALKRAGVCNPEDWLDRHEGGQAAQTPVDVYAEDVPF